MPGIFELLLADLPIHNAKFFLWQGFYVFYALTKNLYNSFS